MLNAEKPWAKVQVALEYTPSGILQDIRCGLIQSKYMCVGSWYSRSSEGVGGCLFGAALMSQPQTVYVEGHDEVEIFQETEWGKLFWENAVSHYERVYGDELYYMQTQLRARLGALRWAGGDFDEDEISPIHYLISAYDRWGDQPSYRTIRTWPATKFLPEASAIVLNERGRNKLIGAIEAILHDRAFEVPDCPTDLFVGCLLAPRETAPV